MLGLSQVSGTRLPVQVKILTLLYSLRHETHRKSFEKKVAIGPGGLYPTAMTAKLQFRSYASGTLFLPDPT